MIGLNSITLRKVNVEPYGCDKMFMEKDLIQNKLYQLIGQFNERKINIEIFILPYLILYIQFMMEMEEININIILEENVSFTVRVVI